MRFHLLLEYLSQGESHRMELIFLLKEVLEDQRGLAENPRDQSICWNQCTYSFQPCVRQENETCVANDTPKITEGVLCRCLLVMQFFLICRDGRAKDVASKIELICRESDM